MSLTNNLHTTKGSASKGKAHFEVGSKIEDFIGTWFNAIKSNNHIDIIEIKGRKDGIYFSALGGRSKGLGNWHKVKCSVYSSQIGSSIIEGFSTSYDFGDLHIQVAGNLKYGVLVVQTYNTFNNDRAKNNFFTREFFHKKNLSK